MERGEKIDRLWDVPHRCRTRWRLGSPMPSEVAYVSVGELGDTGRWYVDAYGSGEVGTRAYPTEADARSVAGRLMASQEGWERVPCYPTPEHPFYDGPPL